MARDFKLKLWNDVFQTHSDEQAPEIERISKLLYVVVMLELIRQYSKRNDDVPSNPKPRIRSAVKKPAKFISRFLKQRNKMCTMTNIFETKKKRYVTDDESKKVKYARKMKATVDNFDELMADPLKAVFNKDDYLKIAFVQYMLYAFETESREVVLQPIF